ncbi:hypothetical protein HID58_058070 [Brassica napus]|uniref:BnaC04g01500D protein n=4 Tax=Brassica TaxID=3705 RepID=A0A078GFH7_BRANA|nr:hypothetical protein HID58_058070 [Brassica napus]CAF1800321.1 unnamed protein product [Brassica napus]CDY23887.1 BnaC04g01500D [Brassica napus]VDD04145.1 unnamed protein product [Brassica oleracea]
MEIYNTSLPRIFFRTISPLRFKPSLSIFWRRKRFIFFLFKSEITMTILCNNGRKRDKRRRKEKEKLKEENPHQCCCYCVLPTFSMVRGIKRCLFLSCYPFIRCLGFEDRRHRHHLHNHNHFL